MAIYKDVASLEVVGYTEPKGGTFSDGVQFILEKLDAIPEAEVEPVRHGHWAKVKENIYGWKYACSVCNGLTKKATFGCPRCRAKMDEKENGK